MGFFFYLALYHSSLVTYDLLVTSVLEKEIKDERVTDGKISNGRVDHSSYVQHNLVIQLLRFSFKYCK